MEPPGHCILLISTQKEFLLFNGTGFLLLLFLFARLAVATYDIRRKDAIAPGTELSVKWSFRKRITVQFFMDVFLILIAGTVVNTPGYGLPAALSALLLIVLVVLLIPGHFNAAVQRFFDRLSQPLHRMNAFVNDAPYSARENKVKELEQVLENSESESPEEDAKTFRGIVRFTEISVAQIMTPVDQMVSVNDTFSLHEILNIIRENRYSRMPVFNSRTGRVTGILHAKDLLSHLGKETADWRPLLRPAFFVSEERMVMDLLEEFQQRRKHIAIVIGKSGKPSGLVTLEDIVEEIVGDISDEFDDEEVVYSKLDESHYIFEARTALSEVEKITGAGSDIFDGNYAGYSLSGLIKELCGRVPVKSESISFHYLTFTIEAADKRQVKRVKITVNK